VSYLPALLLILVAGSIGATVIALMFARRSIKEARSTIFPVVREEETMRARWAGISSVIFAGLSLLFFTGWLAYLVPSQPNDVVAIEVESEPSEVAAALSPPVENNQATVIENETIEHEATTPLVQIETRPLDTPTLLAKATTSVPPLPSATATPTASKPTPVVVRVITPTITPKIAQSDVATLLAAIPIPVMKIITGPSPIRSAPDARLGPISFTTDAETESPTFKNIFPENVGRVYAIYPFSGMVNGAKFTMVWYHDDQELWRSEQDWQWGMSASSFTFINNSGEGTYRVELYVNGTILASNSFDIQ
jgi:hypothetical protein